MERRNIERISLVFYLRVFDGLSSRLLGHLLDISHEGIMLITESQVVSDQDFQLRMRLPTRSGDQKEIILPATTRWCRRDGNPGFFLAGFQMKHLGESTSQHISSLIKDFGYERCSAFSLRDN